MSCYPRPAGGRHTGEPRPATSDQPQTPAPAERKLTCLRLVVSKRGTNQCANEQLDDYGLCLHHLEGASAHWAGIVADIIDKIGGADGDKLRAVVDTLRRYSGGRP